MCRKSGCDYEDCQNGHGNMEALIRHRQFRNSSTSKGIRSRMTVHRFIDFTSNIANISKTTVSLSLSLLDPHRHMKHRKFWQIKERALHPKREDLQEWWPACCRPHRSWSFPRAGHQSQTQKGLSPALSSAKPQQFNRYYTVASNNQWVNEPIAKYIQTRAMACMSKYEGPFRSSYSFLRKAEHRDRIQEDLSLCSQPKGAGGKAPKRWSSGSQQAWPAFQSKGLCL